MVVVDRQVHAAAGDAGLVVDARARLSIIFLYCVARGDRREGSEISHRFVAPRRASKVASPEIGLFYCFAGLIDRSDGRAYLFFPRRTLGAVVTQKVR